MTRGEFMPTNFERAKIVIDKLLPIAERLVDGDVDDMVRKRLASLSRAYGSGLLNRNRAPVDYTKTTTHIAYCYRSLPAHADWFSRALSSVRGSVRAAILKRRTTRVVCMGGGPGSDMLGLLKFAVREGLAHRRFRFTILDRERRWNNCRSLLIDTFEGEVEASEDFQSLDITADGNWTEAWDFCDADIVTLSFFLSEVWSFNGDGGVSRFLQEVLDRAPVGTLFCYIDNGGEGFTPLAEAEFDREDMEIIGSQDFERIVIGSDEQCSVVTDEYRDRFHQSPKLTGNIAWRFWKKIDA